MPQILHIISHLGGGVGKALSGITACSGNNDFHYGHKVLLLDKPKKMQFIEVLKKNGIEVVFASDIPSINSEMDKADIIQLSWWHHPKMAEFLHSFPQVPVRLIIWSHVSGCNYPALPFEFVKIPHKAFFTTKYSFETPYWTETQKEYALKNAEVVYGTGDFGCTERIERVKHMGFNIGYVGTINYTKLNPNFVDFCAAIDIPDTKFIMVGDTDNRDAIEGEAKRHGISDRFEFTGYTDDVGKELARLDVFGYPLNPWHFGSTENAMLEAMVAGVPVVALNQCAEKHLIEHMQTGLLANSKEHYVQLIRYLYENPNERKRIGENARRFVLEEFSLKKATDKVSNVYDAVMRMPKRIFEFDAIFGSEPYEWFLSCLGADKELFENSIDPCLMANTDEVARIEYLISNCRQILKDKSKSSIHHFARYFTYDDRIMYWKSLFDSC